MLNICRYGNFGAAGGASRKGLREKKRKKETDPENHTALLFNGTSPQNAVLNHTRKEKKKAQRNFCS